MPHPRALDVGQSVLLVIDVQESYRSLTVDYETMVQGVRRLIEAARILDVPVLATEQYPKGLGHLVPEVMQVLPSTCQVAEKISLSCCGDARFAERLRSVERRQVLVCGLEAHACVNQTVHDLLDSGFQVHVPYDAIASRRAVDYRIGWEKMIGSGAIPSTVETACLEWLRVAGTPQFKAIQKLIR